MNVRASYSLAKVTESVIFIVDNDIGTSVTNDAEAVVAQVARNYPGRRIMYRDTTGCWDELKHFAGRFRGFGPGFSPDDRQY